MEIGGHIRGNILGSYKYYLIDNEFFYHINISCSASRTLCVAKRRCYVVCTSGALLFSFVSRGQINDPCPILLIFFFSIPIVNS